MNRTTAYRLTGLCCLMLACLPQLTLSQAPPGTDVYLLPVVSDMQAVNPVNLSQHPGYDNQPAFSPDGQSLYFTRFVASADGSTGQTDIYRVELDSGKVSAVTRTDESEYSPTPMPGQAALSVIRVEPPDNRQRLWQIPLDRTQADSVIFASIEPVGYHAWATSDSAAMFILGESFTLQVNTPDGGSKQLADRIGRGIEAWHDSQYNILYIDQQNEDRWTIRAVDTATGETRHIIDTRPGAQDFAIDRDNRFWMAEGTALYCFRLGIDEDWHRVADYAEAGLGNISRIAVDHSGTRLAIVADEVAAE